MPVLRDIIASYAAPARVVARKLAEGPREDRALAILMGALGLIFVSEWPGVLRDARLDHSVPIEGLMSGRLMALIFLAPLIFYGLAALLHLALRLCGAGGTWYGARLALFWSLLACTPLILVQGLVAGMIGPGPVLTGLGLFVLLGFLWLLTGAVRATTTPAQRGEQA